MPTLATGINTALSSILANAQAIEITSQNVANINTPGYRRQVAAFASNEPTAVDGDYPGTVPGQNGNGVTIDRIQRFSSSYLDARFRAASGETSSWQARQALLTQAELIMSPTSDSGLPAQLDQFWAAWGNLASDPSNLNVRQELLTQAGNLTNTFNNQSTQLKQLRTDQNQVINDQVNQINSAATEVASLNNDIARILALGQQPNDLLDQRDQLLDQLAKSSGAVAYMQPDGRALVSINGHALVTTGDAIPLVAAKDPNSEMLRVEWADGEVMNAPSGTLEGTFIAHDQTINGQLTWLNDLASALSTAVNAEHVKGTGLDGSPGIPFFTLVSGTDPASFTVNPALTASKIAAGATAAPGDSVVANIISGMKTNPNPISGLGSTFNLFLNNQVTSFASEGQRANTNTAHNQLIVDTLTTQRTSESGVSLDEEAANLAKYERAYQAAGRMISAFDSLMDTIINGMGAGR